MTYKNKTGKSFAQISKETKLSKSFLCMFVNGESNINYENGKKLEIYLQNKFAEIQKETVGYEYEN